MAMLHSHEDKSLGRTQTSIQNLPSELMLTSRMPLKESTHEVEVSVKFAQVETRTGLLACCFHITWSSSER